MPIKKLGSAFALLLFFAGLAGAVPAGFNIQGRLTDMNGINRDGTYQMTFSIFDAATGGIALWEQNFSLSVQNGNFQVILQGPDKNNKPLEDTVKNLEAAYVEIMVSGEAPMVPRQPLLRSPFASSDKIPAGTILNYASITPPEGWLLCNGQSIFKDDYPELFAVIGCTFGCPIAEPNKFNLPDLRGEFVRGFDAGRGVDNYRVFGSTQADIFKSHTHPDNTFQEIANTWRGGGGVSPGNGTGRSALIANTGIIGGVETRPRNVALTYIIKR
ncbi:MAG: hypothetical protein COT17_03030 [Elusimicrobia bacterium CG08_land_8_20_14_0_20_51_18]|nr:MAG: hypothetical protein COT17_03030 [Elusimicrobia bacterium CG08_land_8_20_14_0_20_51_18]